MCWMLSFILTWSGLRGRLLTSLFLLAHLVAEQMVQQGANFMLGNCPSVPLCLCQRSGVQSESGQPADVPSSQPAYPDGHRSRSVSSRPAHVMEAGKPYLISFFFL